MAEARREPLGPREAAAQVAARLEAAGHVAYFAGGCVRDELLGLAPADYDVATSADPDAVRGVFPNARGVGEHFGVMLVRLGGRTIEVATFRGEGSYSDGRRPERVHFSDERTDAMRRDFTINGLFLHPASGRLVDHVGGQADLSARVLRAIGDADARLQEDRLRLLRAVRFAARFALQVDAATEAAVVRHAGELRGVSRERVGHEVRRMLAHGSRSQAIDMIERLGLASSTLLEGEGPANLSRVRALPGDASVACTLCAWLLDRGGDLPWRERVHRWTDALVLSNHERDGMLHALSVREALLAGWSGMAVAARKRLAAGPGFTDGLALVAAEQSGVAAQVQADLGPLRQSGLAPAPLLDGHVLQSLGLHPGPDFRRILDAVYDAQLEGRVQDEPAARSLALQLAGKR